MAMANMNLIGVFVTKLWPVQALACGGGGDGGGATKTIISPTFSNFGDIIRCTAVVNEAFLDEGFEHEKETFHYFRFVNIHMNYLTGSYNCMVHNI